MKLRDHLLGAFVAWHLFAVLIQALPDISPEQVPALAAARSSAEALTRPYQQLFGVTQMWKLFAGAGVKTRRIEIWVREDAEWRVLYTEGPPANDWRAEDFTRYRWRETLLTLRKPTHRKDRVRFAQWVAQEVFDEMPAVDAVRVEVAQVRVPPPAELREVGGLVRVQTVYKKLVLRGAR